MKKSDILVAIIMGSKTDWPTMKHAALMLDKLTFSAVDCTRKLFIKDSPSRKSFALLIFLPEAIAAIEFSVLREYLFMC